MPMQKFQARADERKKTELVILIMLLWSLWNVFWKTNKLLLLKLPLFQSLVTYVKDTRVQKEYRKRD